MTSKIISEGVWSIYVQAAGGRRLLDGEATDGEQARRLYRAAIFSAPPSTRVELENPHRQVVDTSQGSGR